MVARAEEYPQRASLHLSCYLNDKVDEIQYRDGRYRPDHRSFDVHGGIQRPTVGTAFCTCGNRLFTVAARDFVFFVFHFTFFQG